jgi:hypothetical protein
LHDPEQRLRRGRRPGVRRLGAGGPAQGQLERALGVDPRGRVRQALVERMDDVGAERLLDLDRDLGRKKMRRAVDGRTELDAGLGDFSELREAEHLEAAGVGEDRPVPAHEAMQSAELAHQAVPRPEKQVIGVGEHDLGAGGAEVIGPERLH